MNIILDYVFVLFLGMGAEGAGIATCISNIISFIYLLCIILRTNGSVIVLNPSKLSLDAQIAKQVILVGIPAAAIIVLGCVANITLTHFMSEYGDVSIAAFGIVQKIGSVAIQITVGLTQGIMPLLGYCYGANDLKRLKEINNYSFFILACYTLLCLLIVMTFAKPLVKLFISEQATVNKGVSFLRIWFFCAPGMCFTNLFGSIFQAMGKWVQSLALSIIRQAGILFPLLIFMSKYAGETGLVYAQPISDTVSLIVGIIFYILLIRKIN